MRIFFSIILILTLPVVTLAQKSRSEKRELKREKINAIIRQEEEGVITYTKSFLFGAKLTTDGYGGFFEWGKATSIDRALLFQVELTERKDPREEKLSSRYPYSTPLIYGKINYVYPLKLGVQQQFLFGNKLNKNGVSVSGNIGGGASLALLRPYFVQVERDFDIEYIKYTEENRYDFLYKPIGGPSFSSGWGEIKITPGAYVKAAARFDYGRFNEIISALEVGLAADYYTKGIPQMVDAKQKSFFFQGYVSILFGKRK
ncbi:MAG: hypothetical protein J5I50_01870 [Chitinophagaceae bacterium]|nr:hypothetical protein [Chitinophagaceae bacterium]